jgi:iron complex transport system substrate-binding protein
MNCVQKLLLLFGLALSVQAQPARIVSTFPSVTETLFALGAGDRVVGVSIYCRYPPAALALPKIGTYTKPDPEKIALLRPDLVIIQNSATSLAERLSALGIRYAQVKIGSLAEVYTMISDVGRAVDLPDRASKLNSDIRTRLEAIRTDTRRKTRPSVLMIVGRDPGQLTNFVAVGASTYLGELLEIAGGNNAMVGTTIPYPRISLESVIRFNPDVILDMSNMRDTAADSPSQEERLQQPWLTHTELAAVRNKMVFGLISEVLVTPGPRVIDAVELIREFIQKGLPR